MSDSDDKEMEQPAEDSAPESDAETVDQWEVVDENEYDGNIWMRGLFMIILAILFGIAEMILVVFAVLQFLWLLFSKEKNDFLADTGETIGTWLREVARFQTGATEEKPFPWRSLD